VGHGPPGPGRAADGRAGDGHGAVPGRGRPPCTDGRLGCVPPGDVLRVVCRRTGAQHRRHGRRRVALPAQSRPERAATRRRRDLHAGAGHAGSPIPGG
jgi:hypothetical protein